jgi:hypothetical protein
MAGSEAARWYLAAHGDRQTSPSTSGTVWSRLVTSFRPALGRARHRWIPALSDRCFHLYGQPTTHRAASPAHKRSVRRDDKGHFINEKVLGFRAEAGGAYAY